MTATPPLWVTGACLGLTRGGRYGKPVIHSS